MRLGAALTGNLETFMAVELENGAKAVTSGTHKALNDLKMRLRQQTLNAFGSQGLANTWRSHAFPKTGASLGAAGVLVSKAPHIIDSFDAATVIRSKDGFFLAIPSPDCPKGSKFEPITPSNFPEDRFGRLRFVYRPGKTSLLVVDGVKRTSAGRVGRQMARNKAGGFKQGAVSVVMFFLVPYVRMKKAFNLAQDYDRAAAEMVRNILEAWE
ncbi:hypothetical protein ASG47_19715 [Devosia sp. Leaf420]|uniref:DUF6441 family protein n=1 Tax=Devosia sp. Leaf420 TaxID=1736374 RepID=UPI000715F4F2|nr:DUF6441 family protein [Devosia sp. Leaf420]KQT50333.1 hypothetical protein ASG47_19715 [Devosia sp. Leaf420]